MPRCLSRARKFGKIHFPGALLGPILISRADSYQGGGNVSEERRIVGDLELVYRNESFGLDLNRRSLAWSRADE